MKILIQQEQASSDHPRKTKHWRHQYTVLPSDGRREKSFSVTVRRIFVEYLEYLVT